MTYIATLTLSQQGRSGTISSSVDYSGDVDHGPESHECMKHLEDLWAEMRKHMDVDNVQTDDREFSATLELKQDQVGGDVFTKLEMHPRLAFDDEGEVPTSYEAICFLAQVWLQMAGVIDENGDVLDEDAVERSMDLRVTKNPTLH